MTFSLVPACIDADGDHGGLGGGDLAGDDGLQPHDERGGHDDGIDAGLRHRAVRAAPEQADLQAVGRGGDRPGAAGDGAGGPDHDVLAEHDVRLGEAVEQAVVDHRPGALRRLFGRLEDHHQCAPPRVACLREQRGRAHQPGDMHVVAAGMRPPARCSPRVRRRDLAGIGEAGRLCDRQRVHVGAQHDGRAVAVAKQTDDAGLPDPGRHLIAGVAKPVRGQARRARLLHRQLGMRVDVLV